MPLLTFDFPAKNAEKNFRNRKKPTGERLLATLPFLILLPEPDEPAGTKPLQPVDSKNTASNTALLF
jgi:hypothetical protein